VSATTFFTGNAMTDSTFKEFVFAGSLIRTLLGGADTGRRLCLLESLSPGASGTPIHMHAEEDETFYVLEGELQVWRAGEPRTLRAGEAAFLPRGVPHQIANTSGQPARYLVMCTPCGFEEFVEAAGRLRQGNEAAAPPTGDEIARMQELAPAFGITLMGEW
jgi:mannose-6-phosphate isomerase-like protein (cupin superfamily)